MAVRTCRVTCTDPRGIAHTIQVSAQTLYEAVAQALRIFREDAWCEDLWQSAASLVVKIGQPAIEHRVRIKDFTNWLFDYLVTGGVLVSTPAWLGAWSQVYGHVRTPLSPRRRSLS